MVTTTCLLIGSFLILQAHGTSEINPGGPLCKVNEEFSDCYGHCQATCSIQNPRCTRDCTPGCVCQPGFIRELENGECIEKETCASNCGVNEVYSDCNGHCQKSCSNKDPICTLICTYGCICEPNYVRDDETGECIKEDQCPLICGKNEVVSPCNGHCQKTCTISNPICSRICKRGCVCDYGFVRDDNTGKCIKQTTCPKIKCGLNEVKTKCLPACGQDSCEMAGKKKSVCNTFAPVPCREGCICRNNFFRNADGVCTSAADCLKPVRCPVNEDYNCVTTCPPKTCQSRFALYKCVANQKCVNKCECKDNYLRNKKGKCVLACQCDDEGKPPVKCPVNEEYKCKYPCPPNLCSTRFAQFRCRGDQVCVNKCECKVGYLRNNKGKCVKRDQCEPRCGENEIYACHITCPPKSCTSMVARIICPKHNPCKEQCDCQDNYLRNNDGKCIPSNQCFPSTNVPVDEPEESPEYNYDDDAPPYADNGDDNVFDD